MACRSTAKDWASYLLCKNCGVELRNHNIDVCQARSSDRIKALVASQAAWDAPQFAVRRHGDALPGKGSVLYTLEPPHTGPVAYGSEDSLLGALREHAKGHLPGLQLQLPAELSFVYDASGNGSATVGCKDTETACTIRMLRYVQ